MEKLEGSLPFGAPPEEAGDAGPADVAAEDAAAGALAADDAAAGALAADVPAGVAAAEVGALDVL